MNPASLSNPTPLNRNTKFFSEEEYQYYLGLAREHMSSVDDRILFIKINKQKSQVDDVYNEGYSEEIHYENPIELPAIVKLKEGENSSYIEQKSLLRFEEYGNIEVHLLLVDIENYKADITYGDILGYQLSETKTIYFEISNDAQKFYENSKTMFGYRAFWKTIIGVPTQLKL